MTHAEFVAAYREGDITVTIERGAAGKFMDRRLLLPLVRLPVLGLGVALALVGWVWTGFLVFGIALLMPIVVKRTAPNFVMTQALQDEKFYKDALAAGVIELTAPAPGPHPPA